MKTTDPTADASRFSFSRTALEAVTVPPGRTKCRVYDSKVAGLCMIATATGSRSFYLYRNFRGQPREYLIGPMAKVSIDAARGRASELNGMIAAGRDPWEEKKAERTAAATKEAAEAPPQTFGDIWDSYVEHHLNTCKPKTIKEFTRLYNAYLIAWKNLPVGSITQGQVEALKLRIGKKSPATANKTVAVISAIYLARGKAFNLPPGFSPATGVEDFPEQPRERVLTSHELAKVFASIDAEENEIARDYFKMVIYTGMRRTNVAEMNWQDLNEPHFTSWKIRGAEAKNKRPLVVNLIPEATAIIKARFETNPIDSPYVFPGKHITPEQVKEARALRAAGKSTYEIADAIGISQTAVMSILEPDYVAKPPAAFNGQGVAWKRIWGRTGIAQIASIHDLRRTFCTNMIEAGITTAVVQEAMGHRSITTTLKHYAIVPNKTVADATASTMAAKLAEIAKVRAETEKGTKAA